MRVFLAGTNAGQFCGELINKIDFILESFYYIQDWQIPIIRKCKMFLLDSGAFTFMNNFKGKVDWDDYVKKYADFINKYDIKYFFELDIDALVGIEEVERLRNKLEYLTHKKCIPVWHKSRGLDYWKKICKEYNYVAIGGIVIKEILPEDYKYFQPLLKIAHEYGCKVHGLGFTATKKLNKYSFYNVDSTNWKSGSRFGQMHIFNGRYIESKSYKNKRAIYKELDKHNLNEWIKFQKYAEKYL